MSAFVACMQIVTESASVQNRKKNKSCFEKMLGEMGHEGLGRTDDLDRSPLFSFVTIIVTVLAIRNILTSLFFLIQH